jgi:hypothetical protein
MKTALPSEDTLKAHLAGVSDDVDSVLDSLVEVARGIHPAILAEGGLEAALNGLASRGAGRHDRDRQLGGKGHVPRCHTPDRYRARPGDRGPHRSATQLASPTSPA